MALLVVFIFQKKSTEGGKQGGPPNKKLKKDKVAGPAGKTARGDGDKAAAAPRVKPELALPTMYVAYYGKYQA